MQVHVKDLFFSYPKKPVLNGLSFEIGEGEVLGILGINGAGKSTLLKLLCGLLPMQRGFISPIPKEKLGVVFQECSLDPKLTGLENLKLFAALYEKSPLTPLLQRGGFDLKQPVKNLSGGMKRKLELMRVFVHEPSLVLMDEPTTGLDILSFEQFWADLKQRKATILINTHKAEEAERCDRLLLLHEGRLLLSETPTEFKRRVSGDRVVLHVKTPEESLRLLQSSLGNELEALKLQDGAIVATTQEGHRWVPRLVEALPPQQVESVEVRKPSLADAFLKVTGVSLR